MAKTKLNEVVDSYFENLKEKSVSEINEEFVNNNLLNEQIDYHNDYGNLLHALINYEYNEEKILKTIEVLIKNGTDVNFQASATGYTFIHLALYGYTDTEGNDKSYSTDFIVSLIKLAKSSENKFDVNLKDKDGDSIVHAALASEVYTGKVIPIINELLPEFDLDIADNNNDNISKALDKYLNQASDNSVWKKRLEEEKDVIKLFVENKGLSPEKIKSLKTQLDKTLESLLKSMSIEDLKLNEISDLKNRYQMIYNVSKDNSINLDSITKRINDKAASILEIGLKDIVLNPNTKKIESFKKLMEQVPSYEASVDIDMIEEKYKEKLEKYKEEVANSNSLSVMKKLKKEIESLDEEELMGEIIDYLADEIEFITEKLETLNEKRLRNKTLREFLKLEEDENYDFNDIAIEEVREKIKLEEEIYQNYLIQVNDIFNEQVSQVVKPYVDLVKDNIIPSFSATIDLDSEDSDYKILMKRKDDE